MFSVVIDDDDSNSPEIDDIIRTACSKHNIYFNFIFQNSFSISSGRFIRHTLVAEAQGLRLNWLHKYAKRVSDMCAPFAAYTNFERILRHACYVRIQHELSLASFFFFPLNIESI